MRGCPTKRRIPHPLFLNSQEESPHDPFTSFTTYLCVIDVSRASQFFICLSCGFAPFAPLRDSCRRYCNVHNNRA